MWALDLSCCPANGQLPRALHVYEPALCVIGDTGLGISFGAGSCYDARGLSIHRPWRFELSKMPDVTPLKRSDILTLKRGGVPNCLFVFKQRPSGGAGVGLELWIIYCLRFAVQVIAGTTYGCAAFLHAACGTFRHALDTWVWPHVLLQVDSHGWGCGSAVAASVGARAVVAALHWPVWINVDFKARVMLPS